MKSLTNCCQAFATYHDGTRCCKVCWEEVPNDEGDGECVPHKDEHGQTIMHDGTNEDCGWCRELVRISKGLQRASRGMK